MSTGKYTGEYKINNFSLLKVYYEDTKNANFCVLSPRVMNSNMLKDQYLEVGEDIQYIRDSNQEIIGISSFSLKSLNKAVWDIGGTIYEKHINDYYRNNNGLLLESQLTNYVNTGVLSSDKKTFSVDDIGCKYDLLLNRRYYTLELFLTQYYSFHNVYGIHLIVKSDNTGDTIASYVLKPEDFEVTGNRLLYGGDFYLVSSKITIPYLDDNLYFQITELSFDDINTDDNLGYIYDYPLDFSPFVGNKPFPDYIKTELSLDNNFMLNLSVVKENYTGTIEECIREYFGIPTNQISNIEVSYTIFYEGIDRTSELNPQPTIERMLKVSNEYNTFDPIKIGLDINDMLDYDNPASILVNVITEIKVDDKKMTRSSSILLDYAPLVVNLLDDFVQSTQITHNQIVDESRVAEIVENIQVINDQYIEKPKEIKIVQISKPIFIEMVNKDFVYEKKNIYFSDITDFTQLRTKEDNPQSIISKFTSDNKCYFDLTEMMPPSDDIEYELIDLSSDVIIGKGTIQKPQ